MYRNASQNGLNVSRKKIVKNTQKNEYPRRCSPSGVTRYRSKQYSRSCPTQSETGYRYKDTFAYRAWPLLGMTEAGTTGDNTINMKASRREDIIKRDSRERYWHEIGRNMYGGISRLLSRKASPDLALTPPRRSQRGLPSKVKFYAPGIS